MAPRKQKNAAVIQQVQQIQQVQNIQQQQQQQHHLNQYAVAANYEVDPNIQAQLTQQAPRNDADLNLSVLQRHNAEVQSLEHVASFAVIYEYSTETMAWDKSGIEGCLFICKLWPNHESDERYAIIVLNRRGLRNFDYELFSADQVDFSDPYINLMNQDENDPVKVWGLWVFGEPPPSSTATQPQEVTERLQECIKRAEQGRKEKEKSRPGIGRQITTEDLFEQPSAPPSIFSHTADLYSQHATPHQPSPENDVLNQREHLLTLFRQAGAS